MVVEGTRCPSSRRLLDVVARTTCPEGHAHDLTTHNPEFEIIEDTLTLVGVGLSDGYAFCLTCGQPNAERRVELQLRALDAEGPVQ